MLLQWILSISERCWFKCIVILEAAVYGAVELCCITVRGVSCIPVKPSETCPGMMFCKKQHHNDYLQQYSPKRPKGIFLKSPWTKAAMQSIVLTVTHPCFYFSQQQFNKRFLIIKFNIKIINKINSRSTYTWILSVNESSTTHYYKCITIKGLVKKLTIWNRYRMFWVRINSLSAITGLLLVAKCW